jgi:hypothetical protein
MRCGRAILEVIAETLGLKLSGNEKISLQRKVFTISYYALSLRTRIVTLFGEGGPSENHAGVA